MNQALILFSGGIDSTTALYWARERYENIFALTFDYGQRHKIEVRLAKRLCQKLHIHQKILRLNLKQIGGSSLTDNQIPVPEFSACDEITEGTPSTYVPFRNGILLSVAAAWAEVKGISEIVCGFNTMDSPNYPDTRLPFVEAMESAINQGTKYSCGQKKMKIHAPFINMKKSEIIKLGLSLGADYSFSVSCYSGKEVPCLKCSSCIMRQRAWHDVQMEDPLILRLKKEGKL